MENNIIQYVIEREAGVLDERDIYQDEFENSIQKHATKS